MISKGLYTTNTFKENFRIHVFILSWNFDILVRNFFSSSQTITFCIFFLSGLATPQFASTKVWKRRGKLPQFKALAKLNLQLEGSSLRQTSLWYPTRGARTSSRQTLQGQFSANSSIASRWVWNTVWCAHRASTTLRQSKRPVRAKEIQEVHSSKRELTNGRPWSGLSQVGSVVEAATQAGWPEWSLSPNGWDASWSSPSGLTTISSKWRSNASEWCPTLLIAARQLLIRILHFSSTSEVFEVLPPTSPRRSVIHITPLDQYSCQRRRIFLPPPLLLLPLLPILLLLTQMKILIVGCSLTVNEIYSYYCKRYLKWNC